MPVNLVRTIISVFLLAFWLPASSHALLEHFGLIHQDRADHDADSTGSPEHDSNNHETADGKCALSPTHVSVPLAPEVARPFLLCLPGLEWAAGARVELQPSGLAPPGATPPQLARTWQFSFRTALPARAPSLIS